jgi:3-oxoacyl-[acyl-carrier protein] reductase
MFDLSGRVAIVTGASRGIGRAIAVALARQGAYVAINYAKNREAAASCLAEVRAAGGDGEALGFDVADSAAVTAAVEGLKERKGQLHIAVANAGVSVDNLLLRVSDEELASTFATNVHGAIFLARAAVRPMMRAKWGRFIAVSSVVGQTGNAGQTVYAASKAALAGAVKSIAKEYASRNITANVVAPGFIDTEMTAHIAAEARAKIVEATPAGRLGRPEDVAAAVVYLASTEASYVTGQVLGVNGGLYV